MRLSSKKILTNLLANVRRNGSPEAVIGYCKSTAAETCADIRIDKSILDGSWDIMF